MAEQLNSQPETPETSADQTDEYEEQEEIGQDEETETPESTTKPDKPSGLANLLTPEGIIMLLVAIGLDLVGIVLIFFGLDDFGILDAVGIVIIGGWKLFKLFKSGFNTVGQKTEKGLAKLFRGKLSGFLTPIIGEAIPWLGSGPFWTMSVIYTLTA